MPAVLRGELDLTIKFPSRRSIPLGRLRSPEALMLIGGYWCQVACSADLFSTDPDAADHARRRHEIEIGDRLIPSDDLTCYLN